MRFISGGVTAATGFVAAGASAGIKRSRKPDLSLVMAKQPAVCAAVFTRNRVKAPPVLISQQRAKRGIARGVLLNSGCANCMTGEVGFRDARALSRQVAGLAGVAERDVLIASTGIIGRRLPVPRIQRALPALVKRLRKAGHAEAAAGILTTDTMAKEAAVEARINGRLCRLGGMAKGAGMVAPSMATMLCVLTTDVAVEASLLRMLLRDVVEQTFNRISVDGDMSTNDTVFLLASGQSGVRVRQGTPVERTVRQMLFAVSQRLAHLLVKDGEGATRVATIHVQGAKTEQQAHACARQIATSSLVQTMLASGDPNVGRIAAAAGASGAWFNPDKLEIHIGGTPVVAHGVARRIGKELAKRILGTPEVSIEISLHAGRAEAQMLACDLTKEYVHINAHYTT